MYTPPSPPPPPSPTHRKKSPVGRIIAAACALIGLLILAFGSAAVVADNPASSPVTPPAVSSPAASSSTKAVRAKARVVLKEQGNGMASTAAFTVRGDWDLWYSFDCSNFGGVGNFMVDGSDGGNYVNSLASKGHDVTHLHDGNGKMSLIITSECKWNIQVTQLP